MAHILIGFGEALPAPEVVFSLRDAGHLVSVFARSGALPLRHLPLEGLYILPDPAQNRAQAVAALHDLTAVPSSGIDYILPLDDEGLWLVNAALGADPRALNATTAHAHLGLDKTLQVETAKTAGLAVLPTQVIRGAADLEAGVSVPLPAIIKPALAIAEEGAGLAKGGVHYLMTPADVTALAVKWPAQSDPFLVQPLVSGVGEGVFGFATERGVVAWSGHRRVRMMNPHGSGSSACESVVPTEEMRAAITRFMAHGKWRGPFMMEFLRAADGTPWFMELNGRMWGSLALARRQGLEYPAWSVQAAQTPGFVPASPAPPPRPLVVRNLGRDILHLLFTLRGPKTEMHRANWPRFWRSAMAVLRPAWGAAFYNYHPAHRSYLWRDAIWTVKKALRR